MGVIIVHKFNSCIKSADQVVVLESGRVVTTRKHEELLKKNTVTIEMYQIQQGEKVYSEMEG